MVGYQPWTVWRRRNIPDTVLYQVVHAVRQDDGRSRITGIGQIGAIHFLETGLTIVLHVDVHFAPGYRGSLGNLGIQDSLTRLFRSGHVNPGIRLAGIFRNIGESRGQLVSLPIAPWSIQSTGFIPASRQYDIELLLADVHENIVIRILKNQQIVYQRDECGRTLGNQQFSRLCAHHDFRRIGRCDIRCSLLHSVLLIIHKGSDSRRRMGFKPVRAGRFVCPVPHILCNIQVVVIAVREQRIGRVDHCFVRTVLNVSNHGFAIQADQ